MQILQHQNIKKAEVASYNKKNCAREMVVWHPGSFLGQSKFVNLRDLICQGDVSDSGPRETRGSPDPLTPLALYPCPGCG